MNLKQRKAKLRQIVEWRAEARRLTATLSASQRHFIDVAIKYGKELEPDGWLAGGNKRTTHLEDSD